MKQLRDMCQSKDLPSTGSRTVLLNRLQDTNAGQERPQNAQHQQSLPQEPLFFRATTSENKDYHKGYSQGDITRHSGGGRSSRKESHATE